MWFNRTYILCNSSDQVTRVGLTSYDKEDNAHVHPWPAYLRICAVWNWHCTNSIHACIYYRKIARNAPYKHHTCMRLYFTNRFIILIQQVVLRVGWLQHVLGLCVPTVHSWRIDDHIKEVIGGNRHRAVHGLVKEWEGPGPGEGEGEERLPVETTVVHAYAAICHQLCSYNGSKINLSPYFVLDVCYIEKQCCSMIHTRSI